MNREKPSLPHGWLVKISHSYPDRVYYFNIHTGVSTWEMPRLVTQRTGTKTPKPPQREFAPKSPCADFSTDDESDTPANYTDYETKKEKFEPVFSQFQKDIFDDVKNSALEDEVCSFDQKATANLLETSGETANVEHGSKEVANHGKDVSKDDDIVFKGIGKIYPKIKVKVEGKSKRETITNESYDSIPAVLSKIRKDVEEADLRRKLTKDPLKTSPVLKKRKSEKVTADLTKKTTVRKVVNTGDGKISITSQPSKTRNVLQTDDVETVQRKTQRLSTPGGQGIWTRKRRVISESDFEVPCKVEKTDSNADLSLKIHVGANRERKVSKALSSDSSLDLTSEDPVWKVPPESNKRKTSFQTDSHLKRSKLAERKKSSTEVVAAKLDAKIKRRKPSAVPSADVRKVVSSESESNSVQGDLLSPYSVQDEKIGLVQEWLKNIHDTPAPKEKRAISPIKFTLSEERETTEEAMDVDDEDTDSEQMIIDLQEIRGELQFCPSQPACDLSIPARDHADTSTCELALYLVLDTSSLMNHLKMLSDIRDQEYKGYGLPVLVIPWVVVQELDALKHRHNVSISSQNRACQAVKYLNACFTGKHPRVTGQTPKEASEAVGGLKVECNDDRVLQCCMQFNEKYPSSHTVMLSEDVNLCSKALISGIEACGVKSLEGILSLPHERKKVDQPTREKSVIRTFSAPPISALPQSSSQPSQPMDNRLVPGTGGKSHKIRLDRVIVRVKSEIKDTLGPVLETEMKEAFGDIWKSVVHRKPPWSALDIMESFAKHWIAVFGQILPRHLEKNVKSAASKLQLNKVPMLSVSEVIDLIKDLKIVMTDLQRNSRYQKKVEKSLHNLENILLDLQNGNVSNQNLKRSETPKRSSSHSTHQSTNKPQSISLSNQEVQNSTRLIPSTDTSSSSHSKAQNANTNTKSKSSMSKDSFSPRSKDNSNTNLNKKSKSSAEKSVEKKVCDEQTKELICNCFQTVWGNIHHMGSIIEEQLYLPEREIYIPVMHRLLALTVELQSIYTACLSISPLSIYDHQNTFEDFCNQMNTFFIRLNFQPVEVVAVTSDSMLAFFTNTPNRPTLQVGLQQLDVIRQKLRMMVDAASS